MGYKQPPTPLWSTSGSKSLTQQRSGIYDHATDVHPIKRPGHIPAVRAFIGVWLIVAYGLGKKIWNSLPALVVLNSFMWFLAGLLLGLVF